jgi:O-antigen ligase
VSDGTTEGHRVRPALSAIGACWVAAALLAGAPLPLGLMGGTELPAAVRAGAAALLLGAVWRPFGAVLVLAAFAPVGVALSAFAGGGVSATELLTPAVLVGAALGAVRRPSTVARPSLPLVVSAVALAALALASVAVEIASQAPFFAAAHEWREAAWEFVTEDYYLPAERGVFRLAPSGFQLAQGVLLVPFVAALAHDQGRRAQLARMLVAGACAAGAQALIRVFTVAVGSGHALDTSVRLLRELRVASAFSDFNATGSYFAMTAALACGLAVAPTLPGSSRVLGIVGTTVSLVALWLSGSRVAMGALPAAAAFGALLGPVTGARGSRRRLVWAGLGLAAVVVFVLLGHARRGASDAGVALTIRLEFVRTTWRMLQDHPVFGVGAGRYYERSADYSSPTLKRWYERENAHNNYLQIAGELGPLALAAFLGVVGTALVGSARAIRTTGTPLGFWILASAVTLLLTSLGGHPLLIVEVAVPFWLLIGLAGSANAGDREVRSARGWAATLAVVLLLLAGSLPARAHAARTALDLEHVLLGEGRWVRVGGVPQVEFRGTLAVYVPARDQRALITVRAADPARGAVRLTLRLDDRLADVLVLEGPEWRTVPLIIPAAEGHRFRLLQLEACRADDARGLPRVHLRRIESSR